MILQLAYPPLLISAIVILGIWEAVWKAVAMWKCGRNNQPVWYVCIFIFNTVGILPIVYLLWFQRKRR